MFDERWAFFWKEIIKNEWGGLRRFVEDLKREYNLQQKVDSILRQLNRLNPSANQRRGGGRTSWLDAYQEKIEKDVLGGAHIIRYGGALEMRGLQFRKEFYFLKDVINYIESFREDLRDLIRIEIYPGNKGFVFRIYIYMDSLSPRIDDKGR